MSCVALGFSRSEWTRYFRPELEASQGPQMPQEDLRKNFVEYSLFLDMSRIKKYLTFLAEKIILKFFFKILSFLLVRVK